ncbi:MAG: hypothetical protein ABS54_06135 [Hyphomicrobium sp. SCN 65-11]|nr:MAG: hypothetical protein ABS54_06135 [Hyphomicrobium sp. SCN 65-11]
MLLVPARGADDRWAQAQFAHERLRLARRDPTGREAGLIRRAVAAVPEEPGERRIGDPQLLPGAVLAMARFTGAILPDPVDPALAVAGQPGACKIEHAPALEAFFAAPPDLADLVAQARGLLKRADGWPTSSCGPASPLDDVRGGMLTLAYARFARVGLWPARTQADLQAKSTVETLVAIRRSDPGHLRALALLALDVGYLIARQGGRFIAVSGIDL